MRVLLVLMLITAGCSASAPTAATPTAVLPGDAEASGAEARSIISLPLALYVLVEDASESSDELDLSSARTVEEVEQIAQGMNELWAPAGIVFDPIRVQELSAPKSVLTGVALGDSAQFFAELNRTFLVPDPGAINGFYVQAAFGVNGFTPQGSRLFFVVDEPSVRDERVSSHEVGHILGLYHPTDDPARLMFSGTNGTVLTETEQLVARYSAEGLVAAQ